MFVGHEISTLDELKEGGARNIVAKLPPPPTCKVHEEQAKIYCYDCNSLICRDCVVKDHKDHEYEFVKKAAPETKKKLTEQLTPLNEIQVGVQNAVKNVEGAKSEIAAMNESMTTSIKRSFQELRDIINKREKELLAETAATVEKKINNLNIQQKKLEMSSGTIQSLVEFVERYIENVTDEELMSIHAQMMTRISEETEKQQQSNTELDPVEEADRDVTIECADKLKKLCQLNAKIATTPVSVACESSDATVGQASKLDMCLTFQNGRPVLKIQNIKTILTSKVNGSRVHTKIERKQRNSYQIKFIPTVRGRHQMEVMYNETPVLKKPVKLFVTIPPGMLGKPVRNIDIRYTYEVKFLAVSPSEEVVVSAGRKIMLFDKNCKKLRSFTNRQMSGPAGLAVDGSNIFVADVTNSSLLKFDNIGKLLKSVGQRGIGEGEFKKPMGMTIVGDKVIVCDMESDRLQMFTSDLVFVRQFGSHGRGNGQFNSPLDVTHDEDGNLYVTDLGNRRVQVFNTQGKFLRILVTPGSVNKPSGISFSQDRVYISQLIENGKLYVYHKNGNEVCSIPCESSKQGHGGIAVDQDGFIYVCDVDRNQVIVL